MESTTENYFEDPKHLAEIRRFQDYLETLSQVDKSLSFTDYLMLVHYVLNHFDSKYYAIPTEAFESRMAINNYKTILGEDLFSRFMTPELNRANIVLLTHLSSSRDFLITREKILAYFQQHFPPHLNCEVTGFGIAISASSQLITSGQIKSLAVGLVLIFGIMFIMFLSAKVGLIAILPNIYPIIMNFGIMGWMGIRLSMATSLIASIAIGLAVDDTIHYLYRYNREFKKDLNKDRALRDTIKHIGKPIIFTTLTISIGFSILLFSHFKPTATFGFLMVITMVFALIGDLIILPSLMLHVELVTAWDLLKLMPTLGGMSPGIAHELNQPLNAIKMGSDFLKMMIAQRKQIREEHLSQVVHEISHQVDRASEIINRLRAFGQRSDFAEENVNINEPINDVVAILGRQLSLENISTQLDLDETLPQILGNRDRLAQVVYNLIANASEAIVAKKKVALDSGDHFIRINTFGDDDKVAFTVSDTGIGIPEINIGRIHQPFFTTKATGQGKGLGLSISYEIIRDLGGRIDVHSKENEGTTFKATFPCARSQKMSSNNVW
jgi:signal transduction histidine kinase